MPVPTRSGLQPGHEGHLEFGYWSFFGIWSFPRPVHGERAGLPSVVLLPKEGDTKAIWNLVIAAFLGFGVWDLELPPAALSWNNPVSPWIKLVEWSLGQDRVLAWNYRVLTSLEQTLLTRTHRMVEQCYEISPALQSGPSTPIN
jgi:hypothetical protein